MRAGAAFIIGAVLLLSGAALAGSAETGKNVAHLAKEVESKILVKANESVRVATQDCQLSIEFSSHQVAFLVPLRGTRITESENGDGIVLINSAMVRKLKGREAEPYERLYLRFDRRTIDQIMTRFQQVIRACES